MNPNIHRYFRKIVLYDAKFLSSFIYKTRKILLTFVMIIEEHVVVVAWAMGLGVIVEMLSGCRVVDG